MVGFNRDIVECKVYLHALDQGSFPADLIETLWNVKQGRD